MKNKTEISEKVIEINKLEEQADRLYEKSIKQLYTDEQDAIKIIKWMNVYGTIEDCFDECENIANCIEEVLMKNT